MSRESRGRGDCSFVDEGNAHQPHCSVLPALTGVTFDHPRAVKFAGPPSTAPDAATETQDQGVPHRQAFHKPSRRPHLHTRTSGTVLCHCYCHRHLRHNTYIIVMMIIHNNTYKTIMIHNHVPAMTAPPHVLLPDPRLRVKQIATFITPIITTLLSCLSDGSNRVVLMAMDTLHEVCGLPCPRPVLP